MKKYKNYIFLYIIVLLCSLLFFSISTYANTSLNHVNITQKEKAVFAFFRALGAAPDYEYWITSGSRYKSLPENKKESYLLNETLRLGRGFSSFNADKDLLELKIDVYAKYVSPKNGDEPRILFDFLDRSDSYTPTFNYPYGDEILSLIINRLAIFSNMKLNDKQNRAILKKIPYKDEEFDAKLTIRTRVHKANYKTPISKDPVVQWMMVGEVGYIKCETISYNMGEKQLLWDYVAPWYEEIFRLQNMKEEEKYPHPFDLFKD